MTDTGSTDPRPSVYSVHVAGVDNTEGQQVYLYLDPGKDHLGLESLEYDTTAEVEGGPTQSVSERENTEVGDQGNGIHCIGEGDKDGEDDEVGGTAAIVNQSGWYYIGFRDNGGFTPAEEMSQSLQRRE